MNENKKIEKILKNTAFEIDKIVGFENKKVDVPKEINENYEAFIYIYRMKNRGFSKQIAFGDKASIMTVTTSFLSSLLRQKIISENELKDMFELALRDK